MVKIFKAATDENARQYRELFAEYAASLDFDLSFQPYDYDNDCGGIPAIYRPPGGCMLIVECDSRLAGCVAVRKLSEEICEMKRLYVRPEFRNRKIGRKLAVAIIGEARSIGYKRMRLDTINTFTEANALYRSLGFGEIEKYCVNPIEGAVFMELNLA